MKLPNEYIGREQAFIKHTILKTYLERLFMIIGQSEVVISYVDCFAGPWSDETEALTDTSIGISIDQMKKSVESLKKVFKRNVKFRALYIEKDPAAFARLKQFLAQQNDPNITVDCIFGDYTALIPDILKWAGEYFTFFFVDPKGWKKVIGPKILEPLLKRSKSEFLINVMYAFANRAASIKKHDEDIAELLGNEINFTGDEDPAERQSRFLSLYRGGVNQIFNGRTASVSIEAPGKDRVHYFLVYLTRHPKGIIVFKTEAEEMIWLQRQTQVAVRLRNQQARQPTFDLFAASADLEDCVETTDNLEEVCKFLLRQLSAGPLLIDYECWAKFLQETEFYPTDFQKAIKHLTDKGAAVNIDADIRKRRKNFIKPNWPNKSERWQMAPK